MLRRRLLLWLGSLIALLLVTSFGAILLLHGLLRNLGDASTAGLEQSAHLATVATELTRIEGELDGLLLQSRTEFGALIESVDALVDAISSIGPAPAGGEREVERLHERAGVLVDRVRDLVTGDPALVTHRVGHALDAVVALRAASARLAAHRQADTERAWAAAMQRFRWSVFGLGLVFLFVINASILLLLHAASLVLRPVDVLVDANRRLAREEFGHRIRLDRRDEFGELARATNHLAEELERNEQRKVETLHQVARTLNHELNNALAIIELQLELVARTSGGDPQQAGRLREIRHALERMTGIVADLTRVRRIVLTDYAEGVKMLDLARSVDEPAPAAPVGPVFERGDAPIPPP